MARKRNLDRLGKLHWRVAAVSAAVLLGLAAHEAVERWGTP